MQTMKRTLPFVVAISVIVTIFVVLALLLFPHNRDGEESEDCMRTDQFSSPGSSGMSASGYTTLCSIPAASIVTYVHLHPTGQLPNSKNLVFRFSQRDTADVPKIQWINGRKVVVEATHVQKISKMDKTFGTVEIDYKISSVR